MTHRWTVAIATLVVSTACTTPPDVSSPEPPTTPEAAAPAEPASADPPPAVDDPVAAPAATPDPPGPSVDRPSGEKSCKASSDCESGQICLGQEGCDQQWTCVAARPCTRDLVTYCGCDGATFESSGSCPDRPYRARGACP